MTQAIVNFRNQLQAGHICLGAGIGFTDPLVTEAIAGSADFIFVDLEHSGLSHETLLKHLLATRSGNTPGLVRVPAPSEAFIKPALDGGADGIIAPQIKTIDEVQRFVDACRYPPQGTRGFGPRIPSNYGRVGGPAFIEQQNEAIFVAVQIETVEALEALDDILAVEGLDSVFIGPYDLSGALGVLGELTNPKVIEAIDHIIERTRAAGKFAGAGMRTDPDYAYEMAKRGVQWMQVGSDFGFLVRGMDQIAADIRSKLEEGSA